MLKAEMMNRLVCAKYLYQSGIETHFRGGRFSGGMAVLSFQDAVELFLRAIAEHVNAGVPDKAPFNEILSKIESASQKQIPNRLELLDLNRMRVQFKHYGTRPHDEHVRKSRSDLESFFTSATPLFFDISFSQISMVDLIRDSKAGEFLRDAEKQFTDARYGDSIAASAAAFEVFMKHQKQQYRHSTLRTPQIANSRSIRDEVGMLASHVQQFAEGALEEFEKVWRTLEIIFTGVVPSDYRRFKRLAPDVMITGADTAHFRWSRKSDDSTSEEALYCMDFTIQTILRLESSGDPQETESPVSSVVVTFAQRDTT